MTQPGSVLLSIIPLPSKIISASDILYEKTMLSELISEFLTIPFIFIICSSPLTTIFLLPEILNKPFVRTESIIALIFVFTIPEDFVDPPPLKSLFAPRPKSTPGKSDPFSVPPAVKPTSLDLPVEV